MAKVEEVALVAERVVKTAPAEKRLVVVAAVPVAEVKSRFVRSASVPLRVVKPPVPENEPLILALVKMPPSVREEAREERRPESASLWRVTVGRVSARRI